MGNALPTIYIARHCKTAWNLEGRLQGKIDLPLCEEGTNEAHKNAAQIKAVGIDRIVSSNKKRARQTAQIYGQLLHIPFHVSPNLNELDHGAWEGRRINDLMADPRLHYADWVKNPESVRIPEGSETVTYAQRRIIDSIRDFAELYRNEIILFLTHKHISALLMCALYGAPLTKFGEMVNESTCPCKIPAKIVARVCTGR